jgi:hypothetical protein
MDEQHPASIRRDLRRQLVDIVHPRALYGIAGDAPDPEPKLSATRRCSQHTSQWRRPWVSARTAT